jgi:NitT/TauT family transport system substrate-binding protein
VVMGGYSEAPAAAAGGADLVILGISVPKYTQLLEVPASVKAPADLKGKTLGVPAARGTVDIATRAALTGMGLQPDTDVKITALGSVQAVAAAVLSGAVDGAAMNVPDNLAAEAKGLRPLINMATDPKAPAAASNTIYSQRSYIAAHKDIIQNYVDSEILAVARLKKDKSIAETVVRKYLKIDDQKALDATYDFYSNGVFPDLPFPRPELFDFVKQQVGKENPAVLSFDVNKILDPSFVQSAADRGLDKS